MYETQKEVLTNEIIDAGLKDPEAVAPSRKTRTARTS